LCGNGRFKLPTGLTPVVLRQLNSNS